MNKKAGIYIHLTCQNCKRLYRYSFVLIILSIMDLFNKNINLPSFKVFTAGFTSGGLMLLSLFLGFTAIKMGDLTLITPIEQSSFVFTSLLCFIVLKEKLSKRKVSGIIFAILCNCSYRFAGDYFIKMHISRCWITKVKY